MSNPGNLQFPIVTGPSGQYTEDYYIYTVGPFNLATNATSTQSFNVQADSSFEWMYTTFYANIHSATFATPIVDNNIIPVNVLISDGGSGRQLFSAAVPLNSLAGIGREPFVLPITRIFMSKSTVNLTFTSFDATNAWDNIQLSLHGRKLFQV